MDVNVIVMTSASTEDMMMTRSEKWRATRAKNIALEKARLNTPISLKDFEIKLKSMGFIKHGLLWTIPHRSKKGHVEINLLHEIVSVFDFEGGKDGYSRWTGPYLQSTADKISNCI